MKDFKLMPKLRFKEFNDSWYETYIGKVLTIGSGKDYKHLNKGSIPVYGTGGLMTFVDEFLYDGESVCIGRKGTIDKPVYLNEKFWTVDTLFYTYNFKESLPKFIYHIFQNINWKLYNEASGVPSLSKSTIEKIKINLPSIPEQQKIASFLSSVDIKIDQLQHKKSLLEQYKKGVMQQLFSQQLRFKDNDGNDYPDWEEKKLGDVFKIGSGKDYKYLNDGAIPVYGTGGLMTFVDDYLYDGESVGIGRKGTIDKPVFLQGKFWTVDTLFYTHSFKKVLPRFVFYKFIEINWKKYNDASGVPSLSKSTIEKIDISIPSIQEQTKIANFLSVLDTKIESVNTQIETTQQFKKGLLQQMFV